MLTHLTNQTLRYGVTVSRRKLKRAEQRICPLNNCQAVGQSVPKVVK